MRPLARPRSRKPDARENPVALSPGPKPFLGAEAWSYEPGTKADREAASVLRRFYCSREDGEYSAQVLADFLKCPSEDLFIVWGDVGVGKTWFLRYELELREPVPRRAAVIDALQGLIESGTAYRRLCPILEQYFLDQGTSAVSALEEYRRTQLARRLGHLQAPSPDSLAGDSVLNDWKLLDYGPDLANLYLAAMDLVATAPLFLVLDNLDKASEEEQESVLHIATRLLRNRLIKLIVPLRRTSGVLGDRFAAIHEYSFRSLELGPLDMKKMLQVRFRFSQEGQELSQTRVVDPVSGEAYSFPELFDMLYARENSSGDLVDALAGSNARIALHLTSELLFSGQLRGLRDIGDPEYALATWMLGDTGEASAASPLLLNLFDSGEDPPQEGYSLLRYRVLEYLIREGAMDCSHAHVKRHFARLGYEASRVRRTLVDFLGSGLVRSSMGYAPEAVRQLDDPDSVGSFSLTRIGESYWVNLLHLKWYYVVAGRATRVPISMLKQDAKSGSEYLGGLGFAKWLKDEEDEERQRAKYWDMHNSPMRIELAMPSREARRLLLCGEQELDELQAPAS